MIFAFIATVFVCLKIRILFLQGTGYWEFLLTNFYAVDVVAFDSNTSYPESMRYMETQVIVLRPFCNFYSESDCLRLNNFYTFRQEVQK